MKRIPTFLLVVLAALGPAALHAADQVVTSTGDSGAGSLRRAIADVGAGETITFDAALSGGTIDVTSASLSISKDLTIDASVLPNGVTISGGGGSPAGPPRIFVIGNRTVTLRALTIADGSTVGEGGGNSGGAGILHLGTPGGNVLTIDACTFRANHALGTSGAGGAIFNYGDTEIRNSTFTDNRAEDATGRGAVIFIPTGTVTLTHCTLAANGPGSGVIYTDPGATLVLGNTIISDNASAAITAGTGTVTDNGGNYLSSGALLSPLGDYGGNVPTMLPAPHSPVVDNAVASAVAVDQRGFPRPFGAAPDSGAVETGSRAPSAAADSVDFGLDTRNYVDSTPPFTVDTVAPDLIANTGITDAGGMSFTVTMAMLEVTGGGDGMDEITFTLVSAPVHGTLKRDGVALGVGGTFTQADVDAGLVTYERAAGTALTDILELSAEDEAGKELLSGSFFFAVAGLPGAASGLVLVDTRNYEDSVAHVVHTDTRTYLGTDVVPGSLRQALANSEPGYKVVDFDAALDGGVIALGGSQLLVDKDLSIDASMLAGGVTVSGGNASRVFRIAAGTTVSLTGFTVADGTRATAGAGIDSSAASLSLDRMTITGNTRTGAGGGGLRVNGSGTTTVINSTITGNSVATTGGGIRKFGSGSLALIHCTVEGNSADNGGGGIYFNQGGTMVLENTVVARISSNFGVNDFWDGSVGTLTSGGGNLIGNNDTVSAEFPAGVPNGNGDRVGTPGSPLDPLLAPLGDYGGPTETMPPLPGSPAIEGAVLLGGTPATDQRGDPRPTGPLPDIGAVEAGSLVAGMLADSDGDGIPDILEGPAGPYPHLTLGTDDSAVDTDGDGSSDAEEIANMTDLFDSGDYLRLLFLGPAGGFDRISNPLVTVTLATFPGLDYEFEIDTGLDSFEVLPGSTFTADDFTASFELLLDGGAMGFVRGVRK